MPTARQLGIVDRHKGPMRNQTDGEPRRTGFWAEESSAAELARAVPLQVWGWVGCEPATYLGGILASSNITAVIAWLE
jgi:hypothetical protein